MEPVIEHGERRAGWNQLPFLIGLRVCSRKATAREDVEKTELSRSSSSPETGAVHVSDGSYFSRMGTPSS
jgi:hypothetical protein